MVARAPRDPARARHHPGRAGRIAGPPLLLPLRRARGGGPASRGAPGQGDGPVRPVGRGGLPARQPAAPTGARGPGPCLLRPPRRRPPLTACLLASLLICLADPVNLIRNSFSLRIRFSLPYRG